MKYGVDVNGQVIDVDISPDGVRVDGGEALNAELMLTPDSPLARLRVGTAVYEVVLRRGAEQGPLTFIIGHDRFAVEALDERSRAVRSLTATRAVASGPAPLRAPMPGLVVRVYVAPGERVQAGQPLVAMEAMKMENELRASAAGTIKSVPVSVGSAVEKGALLAELE
jgi:biotin carboxyl carrier protein